MVPAIGRAMDSRFTEHGLPTGTRPGFPHSQSLPSGSLHKPLSLTHQRANRRSKKHHLTGAETKTILQKVNYDEKAESYVPEGIR